MKFIPKSLTTRRFIIEQVAHLFNKQGYQGTSLSDLTAATHLTKGSIYGNFENKEEVALAAFDYNLELQRQYVLKAMEGASTYKSKLLAHCNAFSSNYEVIYKNGGCPLLNTATEADDTHEVLRKRAAEGFIVWKNSLVTLLRQGIKAGEFKDTIDCTKIALSIIALIEGALLVGMTTKNPAYLDTILSSVHDLVLQIER